jgi:hypothetical protein
MEERLRGLIETMGSIELQWLQGGSPENLDGVLVARGSGVFLDSH